MTDVEAPLDGVLHMPEMTGKTIERVTFDRDSGGYCRLIIQFTDGLSLTALEQGYAGEFNVSIENRPQLGVGGQYGKRNTMMASELIAVLQALIAEHGDQKIWVSDSEDEPEIMLDSSDEGIPDRIHILGH
jgi:hypothetical protein